MMQRTAKLIQEQEQPFEQRVCVKRRGSINVKGKGPMVTFWICSEKEDIEESLVEAQQQYTNADVLLNIC